MDLLLEANIEYVTLFAAAFLAAIVSASVGFGGALLFLPVLSNMVGIKEAIPVLTIAQLFGNGSRVWFGRHDLKWRPILYFLSGALPLSILGSYLYVDLKASWLFKCIGVFLILIIIYRRLNIEKIKTGNKGMFIGGGATGFISGIAGSAGPLGAAFFLGLNLSPLAYIASDAFASLALHLTKTIVYSSYFLISFHDFLVGAFAGFAMILGSFSGKRIIEKIPKEKYIVVVEVLLLLSGLHLLLFK